MTIRPSHAQGPVVVIGAHDAQCTVVAARLMDLGHPVVMVTSTEERAELLATGGVRLRRGGGLRPDRVVRPAEAMPTTDFTRVCAVLRRASLVVVADDASGAEELAPLLALGLVARATPVNVLVVVDGPPFGAERLRDLVVEYGGDRLLAHGYVGMVLDRLARQADGVDGSQIVVAEARGRMYVDARGLRAPLHHFGGEPRLVEHFGAYALRHLYVLGAGQAALAYLGRLRGHRLMSEAVADPEVRLVARAAMLEGQVAVGACFGERFAGGPAAVDRALARFVDPVLAETIDRAGRDAGSALVVTERILGPARMAMAAGVPAPALALVAAAALRAARDDAEAGSALDTEGRRAAMARLSLLTPHHPLVNRTLIAARGLDAGCAPTALLAAFTGAQASAVSR
jgi:mannitol-1-phosphate 5-dehydrogenase